MVGKIRIKGQGKTAAEPAGYSPTQISFTMKRVTFMSKMLLSIKPEYVNKIISGQKKYEFRKFHCHEGIDTIVIYETAPTKKVVGEVALLGIIEGDVEYVWRKTRDFGGILEKDYKAYYEGRKVAIAYQLGKVTLYDEPMELKDLGLDYVPQSFAYI